jgi:site-specific recombinase XerD
MSKVKFYIDKGVIYLWYYISKKERVRISLKESIDLKHWDKKKQRAKSTYSGYIDLNTLLDGLELWVISYIRQCRINGEYVYKNKLKEAINERIFGKKDSAFKKYVDYWVESKKHSVKMLTLNQYRRYIEKILDWCPSFEFTDMNKLKAQQFENYLFGKGYKKNYVHRIFKVWRALCSDAYIDNIHENKYHMTRNFLPGAEDVDNVYLTLHDIELLFEYLKSADPRYQNAITIFLRGCLTGQRWQTYTKLNNEMIYEVNGVRMVSIRQLKTNHTVSIPVSSKLDYLMKINTHEISRQRLNDYIKESCKAVGIQYWSSVSSHTARRTFATNMVLAGVDTHKIMAITGHKTEREFRKYVKIDGVQSAISTLKDIDKVFGIK